MGQEEKRRKRSEYGKAYYAANREKVLARQKARWVLEHVKAINKKAVAKYRSANVEEIRRKDNEATKRRYAADLAGSRAKARKRYEANAEVLRARSNAYGAAHVKARAERAAKWRKTNPERVQELHKRAREKRKERWVEFLESERKRYRKNYTLDPGKYSAKGAARRAATLRATPPWCDLGEIVDIYRRAQQLTRETGINHDVDHIIPLRGKTVWGLHIPSNLQILTSSANRKKLNRFTDAATPDHNASIYASPLADPAHKRSV